MLIDAIHARTPRQCVGMELVFTPNGFFYRVRKSAGGDTTSVGQTCFFGQLVQYTPHGSGSGSSADEKTGILGGLVECGNRIYTVPNIEIDLATDRVKMVAIATYITPNADSTGSVSLSGIKDSKKPTVEFFDESDENYGKISTPPIFNPILGEPAAYGIVLPLGKLTVSDGTAKFEPTGCGHFTVTHCPGVLSYYRGGVSGASTSAI